MKKIPNFTNFIRWSTNYNNFFGDFFVGIELKLEMVGSIFQVSIYVHSCHPLQQGHSTSIFGKYLFGRRFEIQNFEKVSFDPYNFRITRLSARNSNRWKIFRGFIHNICLTMCEFNPLPQPPTPHMDIGSLRSMVRK